MDGTRGSAILVVEDEALVAMLLEDMLIELGHRVIGPALRPDTAMALARTGAIDAAILDVNLAGTPSYEIAHALVERDIPFAFATGYGTAGLDGIPDVPVIQKPYQQEDVAAALLKLLPAG